MHGPACIFWANLTASSLKPWTLIANVALTDITEEDGPFMIVPESQALAVGESVITCPSPLNMLKDTYDRSSQGCRVI